MNIIEVDNLNRVYGSGEHAVRVLRDVSFRVARGEFVAIMGQSGSGKSTLMNIIGCLDRQTSGRCRIDGVDTNELDHDGLARLRSRHIGFIFQQYNLLGSLPATENAALPAIYAGLPRKERLERARAMLTRLGLGDRLNNRPTELSGGQQQRVSIARALMNGGDIILADEPTGALDSRSGENVMAILAELNHQGHTVILVTHDASVAAHARRIIEIRDGAIISDERCSSPSEAVEQAVPPAMPVPPVREDKRFRRDQLLEAFSMSVQAILAHKMRSALTMLGIIIGIASVVSVVALGRGSQEKIIADIASMGTNTINIYPGKGFGDSRSGRVRTLTVADAEALAMQPYIDSVTPTVSGNGLLLSGNQSYTAQLAGVGEHYFDVKGIKLVQGRTFTADEVRAGASVVVIDETTQKQLFPNGENPLGTVVLFQKRPLTVIGVNAKQETGFGASDSLSITAPYTTVMRKITGQNHIASIAVKIRDDVRAIMVERNLTALLTARHKGVTDFFTMNTDTVRQTIEKTTGTMTLLISGIALISLVVGGIGVMNIMLVSVTERTREIGLRIAVGARQRNIMEQFLIEAVLICLFGGLAGVGLAFAIGGLFALFVNAFPMAYSLDAIVLALACSSAIGIVFGFMPARNASRLNPIQALVRE